MFKFQYQVGYCRILGSVLKVFLIQVVLTSKIMMSELPQKCIIGDFLSQDTAETSIFVCDNADFLLYSISYQKRTPYHSLKILGFFFLSINEGNCFKMSSLDDGSGSC